MAANPNDQKSVLFNDPVHGIIECHWILVKIINTPEFQRLHNIKQLSSTFHVYPEAQHSRFSHSIGTAHLAGKLVRHFKEKQNKLEIDEEDILCVEIAGLCHDLGHGPYSHLFEEKVLPKLGFQGWKHEEQSVRMFDAIVRRFLNEGIEKIDRLFTKRNWDFIKEMINGPIGENGRYIGRDEKKHFLYEIVSNKISGFDVDKFDYFARDCYHLGIGNDFHHDRFMKYTKVLPIPNGRAKLHICVHEKEAFELYEMFRDRFKLHRRAYQHKRKNPIDHMIADALVLAGPHLKVRSTQGITNCCRVGSEDDFCYLDDTILYQIQAFNANDSEGIMKVRRQLDEICNEVENAESTLNQIDRGTEVARNILDAVLEKTKDAKISLGPSSEEMDDAKRILDRISKGDHYQLVGSKLLSPNQRKRKHDEIENEIIRKNRSLDGSIRVSVANYSCGKSQRDPIESVWFYPENCDPEASVSVSPQVKRIKRSEVSHLIPSVFEEHEVQVFCTDHRKLEQAKIAFRAYCEDDNV